MTTTVKIDKVPAIGIADYDSWETPIQFDHELNPLADTEVDIRVTACGVCGSDLHRVKGDWGRPFAPLCVGHEIVGYIVNKGKAVTNVDIGDRVGVGAQCFCCHECYPCSVHKENNCNLRRGTYGAPLPNGKATQGGYGKYVRLAGDFAFKIPEKMKSEHAAPMMCGGITGLKPLLTAGVTKGTKVGVVGVGGIGHFTILFAKALGAEVTAISRSKKKYEIAKQLGADDYIATDDKEKFPKAYIDAFDVIVNTTSAFTEESLTEMLFMLRPEAKLISVTSGAIGDNIVIPPGALLNKNVLIGGSALGTPKDIEWMLQFAVDHHIEPWVEVLDINVENVATAWKRLDKGDCRFRFVFNGYEKFYGK